MHLLTKETYDEVLAYGTYKMATFPSFTHSVGLAYSMNGASSFLSQYSIK